MWVFRGKKAKSNNFISRGRNEILAVVEAFIVSLNLNIEDKIDCLTWFLA